MKQIRNKLYLGLAVLGLAAPLQTFAAGQDSVMLGQDGNQVSVSLGMSNAVEEKITTVAVSLEVKTEDPSQITVDFQFAPNLGNTEHGFVYHEDTGRLDIYVASADKLFGDEKLNLGNVQVKPVDPDKSTSVDVGYCKNSFQTANGAYGGKTPVIEGEIPPVNIQVGNGTLTPPSPPGTSGPGNNGQGSGNGGNTGGNGGNQNEGLYDDTTRFTNDPSSAQKIPSSVIKNEGAGNTLVNLGQGAASVIGGNKGTGSGLLLDKVKDKVSVISPGKGPSSIMVSGGGTGSTNGFLSGITGVNPGGADGSLYADGTLGENGSEEILLDQEKGGAADNRKNEKRNRVIMISAILAAIIILAGGILLLVVKRKEQAPVRRRRKKKRRRRRKKKKPASRRRKPVRQVKRPERKPVKKRKAPAGHRRRPAG